MNVKSALQHAQGLDVLDAQILLAHVLRTSRASLYSHDERVLTDAEKSAWQLMVTKRLSGVPVAYLMGEKECMGMMFEVTPDVLIPRPDTECVIETALSLLKPNASVLDIGTGSGVIACAIAALKPDCHVLATDISDLALAVTQRNIVRHHLKNVTTQSSDLFANIHQSFDLIVSNPPYIVDGDPYLQGEIRYEPKMALVADEQGLGVIRRLIEGSVTHLNAGGWVCLEHGFEQASEVQAILKKQGFNNIQTVKDLSGHDRVTMGLL